MQLYECKVRLAGSLLNEVRKHDQTAADVIMLRSLHGEDAVLDVKHTGSVERSSAEQRQRMAENYGTGVFDSSTSGASHMQRVFGPPGMALPVHLGGVEHVEFEDDFTRLQRQVPLDEVVQPPMPIAPARPPLAVEPLARVISRKAADAVAARVIGRGPAAAATGVSALID